MFDDVLLEPEQKELLIVLVEASRNVPREKRQKFLVSFAAQLEQAIIHHEGFVGGKHLAYFGDIEVLTRSGLLNLVYDGRLPTFDVLPVGLKYYEWYKRQIGEPVRRIEASVHTYITSGDFRQRYPSAQDKWIAAEAKLWGERVEADLSTIGHLCREAMQEFASALVETYRPPDVDPNVAHEISRAGAVLTYLVREKASTPRDLIDAAMEYWARCSGLVQRTEHDAQREKEPLVWDDARAIVFQTAFLMHEIDRLISRSRANT